MSLQKRLSRGLLSTFSFTFSKNLGDVNMLTTSFSDPGQNPGYQNEFNRGLDRSVLGSDLPHRFVWSGVYELPFGRGRKFGGGAGGVMNALIGGWQTNAIYTYQSGQALNFGVAGAAAYAGNRASFTGVTPIQTEGDVSDRLGGVSGGPGYLNNAAFRVPLSFEFGNTPRLDGRNRAPSAFNFTNTPVFGLPNTTVGNAGFGVIGSQANRPRNLQLALKLVW